MGISQGSEKRRHSVCLDLNIPLKKLILALSVCCFGFFACGIQPFIRFLKAEPYLQMQVLWPVKEAPTECIVLGVGSSLTIELKTSVERIEAFIEGHKIAASSIFFTTLQQLAESEVKIARPRYRTAGIYEKFSSRNLEKIMFFDLTMPALSGSGFKNLTLIGWLGSHKIKKMIKISFDPEKLEELSRIFIKDWWCRKGKSQRFRGDTIKWKSELPGLNPYIHKATDILSRWWLGTIRFIEDNLNPDIIIKRSEKTIPFSIMEMTSSTIYSGDILVPSDIIGWPEETIVRCIAHEFGHCLGIAIATEAHPANDSFMGQEANNFRWHPYQRRSAYLIYANPPGTKF